MAENTAAERAFETPHHGEFCWNEMATDDARACRDFYTEVFGWQFVKSEEMKAGDFEYLEFGTEENKQFGGLFQMKPEFYGGEMPKPHMYIYVAVDDLDAAARQAFELGGTIVSPPMDVPGVGRICEIQDPSGAKFFVIKLQS